ncbi:BREX-5 system adenine-specific DNA-methyltransferase PglX [Natronosalvus vescus]|uniref:BREX-5 system adenine-specific DNA-methyltransferase PglX n=1 Tax=Natronosalvus vescus TaxID=2953881 RepID=UPI0020917DA0|nr:BREX-5 system adenine-specific DNA-methyltransferase PglX [Natronosalvus vescus]
MEGEPTHLRKAQLDKEEREHLEDVVTEMRDRVEANVRYQLEDVHNIEDRPSKDASLTEEQEKLIEAIKLEAVEGAEWEDGFEQYLTGVGYTIVNRLAALRCMEVRGFIDDEVTAFRDDGLTPAADRLVTEEFMLEEEAVLEAYHRACEKLAEEIEILFDRSTAYSLLDPDDDTFEDLCRLLDEVPDQVWRADDVLGWVYEYYNVKLLDDLRQKGEQVGLDPEDVPPANQFYTPHWVVRMLTDNSLGKLYLEDTGELQTVVGAQESLSPEERKNRPLSPDESPGIVDFCTYLVPSGEGGEPPAFESPEDIRVIDPACGSGHFLLYAFDVLERIWRAESDLDHAKIPREILRHNLYGVDLDMRACQLAAFNLYLKGRTRSEAEGADGFEMPKVGIVCADAKVADIEGVEEVFDEVSAGKPEVEDALRQILDAFEEVHGLGSLLDVRGTLRDLFKDGIDEKSVQITLSDDPREDHTLGQILSSLREAVDGQRESDSFLAQDLRSFVRLLDVLAQDYDVALMNPPYGSGGLMPDPVQNYVEQHYRYQPQFYVNFFEACENLTKERGRIGMLIPRTFMFKRSFEDFREDFIGPLGSFDFLAEFGLGILDNATVRTAATVVKKETHMSQNQMSAFLRLHDVPANEKERTFLDSLFGDLEQSSEQRLYNVDINEFSKIPGAPMSYWAHPGLRSLFDSEYVLDSKNANLNRKSGGSVKAGLSTGNNDRFVSYFWEKRPGNWVPLAKGGGESWHVALTQHLVNWNSDGKELKRLGNSYVRNEDRYFSEALTYRYHGEGGRRFGYIPEGAVFHHSGKVFIPNSDPWAFLGYLNSSLATYLMLCQTPERRWEVSQVSKIPWFPELTESEEVRKNTRHLATLLMELYTSDFTSFNYSGAQLLKPLGVESSFQWHTSHDFVSLSDELPEPIQIEQHPPSTPISQLIQVNKNHIQQIKSEIIATLEKLDNAVLSSIEISDDLAEVVKQEVATQTPAKNGYEGEIDYLIDIPEPTEKNQARELVHHFALLSLKEKEDGIIPLESAGNQPNMHDLIIDRFREIYGKHAEDRLVEVDEILGAKSAADEAYPNLRAFITDDLFEHHIERMEKTPILWKVISKRMLADETGEGFACFVDYHEIDASLFDRLSNQYLEPRKADLRERRSAANQRRNDESLSTTEQAEATEEFAFCTSELEQIAELEEVMQELESTTERAFDADDRARAEELAPKIAAFRAETAQRIETLAELRKRHGEEWFQDTFSPGFWDKIDDWREEWLDALEELEYACKEYAKPSDEPVEAHLADLFDYFNWRLKGSGHYSSSGILFMTYYFEREGADLLDEDGEPFDTLTKDEQLLASLAMGLDDPSILDSDVDDSGLEEYKQLAEEIGEGCKTIHKRIPSDWADRALSEITTDGYRPNHKHGVAINITPLSEKRIVPDIVEDRVL